MSNINYTALSLSELEHMGRKIKEEQKRRLKDAEEKEDWETLSSAICSWCKKYNKCIYIYENGYSRGLIDEHSNFNKPGTINTQY